MFAQLSTSFTLLATLLVANLADATTVRKDYDWAIEPREGFPSISFNPFTATEEVVFVYDTPLLYENKTYRVTVFEDDCITIGSKAITHLEDASVDRELRVLVDVDKGAISNSPYYTSISTTNAEIGLCLRVDYLLNGESINYHETSLIISIDLTAGFKLDSLQQIRDESLLATFADATPARKDFDWAIVPRVGFPSVAFNTFTATEEVVFMYDTPLLYENKTYSVIIFEADCITIGSNAITHLDDASVERELRVLVDVDQGTISDSSYYTSINMTNAEIGFCLRIDYSLNGQSINYHETNLTISIGLTAGFKLDGFKQLRVNSEQERVNGIIEYPVVVYHCDESNDKLARIPVLSQGGAMQMCVELDPTVNNENIFVVDILYVDLVQEKMDLSVSHKNIINDAVPNPLTSKLCQGGICNIKTQLDSTWFSESIPGDIDASGIALMAFGSLSSGLGQRLLRAPIIFRQRKHAAHGSDLDRELQQGAGSLSTFILSTSLKTASDGSILQEQRSFFWIMVRVSLVICFCCFIIYWLVYFRKKNLSPLEKDAKFSGKNSFVPGLGWSKATDEKSSQAKEGKVIDAESKIEPELQLSEVFSKKSKSKRAPIRLLVHDLSMTDVTLMTDFTSDDDDSAWRNAPSDKHISPNSH